MLNAPEADKGAALPGPSWSLVRAVCLLPASWSCACLLGERDFAGVGPRHHGLLSCDRAPFEDASLRGHARVDP
jgi:hypothetical protein